MNIHMYGVEDYLWRNRENGKSYIAIFDDNTLEIVIAKDNEFILENEKGSTIVTNRIKGIREKNQLTVSIGYYGEKITDYKLGDK